jgi:hypothetical protein
MDLRFAKWNVSSIALYNRPCYERKVNWWSMNRTASKARSSPWLRRTLPLWPNMLRQAPRLRLDWQDITRSGAELLAVKDSLGFLPGL